MTPTPDTVVTHAITALQRLEPEIAVTRDGLALRVSRGSRMLVWNLTDFARQAPGNPGWRGELDELARKVVERPPSTAQKGTLQVRLRPDARVPAELKTGEYSAEPVLDGLWAVYGLATGEGVSAAPWSHFDAAQKSRADFRTVAAAMTLGGEFTYGDMMSPVADGIPIYTNAEFHPNVAAALLMPADYWKKLLGAFDPPPQTLLATIPAPSRIFLTTIDDDTMVAALRELNEHAHELEEELLSPHVYRFDGTGWHAVMPDR